LLLQLRCAHLVLAKAPLLEEAIFNRNKVVAERRVLRTRRKHKEREITKCYRNDNRIKRQKAGERNISSNEDPSPEPSWSGDVASAAVDWSDMSGSSSSLPPRATKVSSSRQPRMAAHDKNVGSSSRPAARPAREDQRVVRPCVRPRVAKSPALLGRPSEAVGGAVGSSLPALRRFRLPRLGLPAEAPVAGEVERLGVNTERTTGGGV
jgi:hypothetical protein